MTFKYDETAVPDPNCAACRVKWPIHVDPTTGKRMHIDVIGFHKDYGFSTDCPTEYWPNEDDDTDKEVSKIATLEEEK